jgi:hypothetical protein
LNQQLTGSEFKEDKSIDTKDNQNIETSRSSSTDNDSISVERRSNSKYSLNSEAGRKNILVLCLLVVCLVSNFNQNRSHLGKQNILNTDLDSILRENRNKLMEALDGTSKNLRIGVNELNSEFINFEEDTMHKSKPHSIVKMNGLVPFVAKRLPFDKNQEDTLYELCLKYANINTNKQCHCPEPKPLKTHPIRRFSKYLDESHENQMGGKPSIESLTLSKHVTNTKALEPYKSLPQINEENKIIPEIQIFDTEEPLKQLTGPRNSKLIIEFDNEKENDNEIEEEDIMTSSLDNFEKKNINSSSFQLPKSISNLNSPFSEFFEKKNVKKVREQFIYQCHLKEDKKDVDKNQFNLVLGKKSFNKLIQSGTYSPSHFTSL